MGLYWRYRARVIIAGAVKHFDQLLQGQAIPQAHLLVLRLDCPAPTNYTIFWHARLAPLSFYLWPAFISLHHTPFLTGRSMGHPASMADSPLFNFDPCTKATSEDGQRGAYRRGDSIIERESLIERDRERRVRRWRRGLRCCPLRLA